MLIGLIAVWWIRHSTKTKYFKYRNRIGNGRVTGPRITIEKDKDGNITKITKQIEVQDY